MKFRGLAIAVLVLAALGGVLFWSSRRKPSTISASVPPSTGPVLLRVDQASIDRLSLTHKGAKPVTLVRTAGKWQITQPQPLAADQDEVSGLLASLSLLHADRLIADHVDGKPAALAPYGLAAPALTIDIASTDHSGRKLLIGSTTPTGDDVYAMLAGASSVYTLPIYNKTTIDKSLDTLRDKRLITLDPEKITSVSYTSNSENIQFARNAGGWQIVKPRPLRADNFSVGEFVRSAADARMDLSPSPGSLSPAAEFAQAALVANITFTAGKNTQSLEVRKNNDGCYARSSVVPGIYKVDSDMSWELGKTLTDFRNRKLFDFGYQDPNQITIHQGAQSWYFTRSGSTWWSGGKKMDAAAVEALVDKLRDLQASSFVGSGFTKPIFEADVTSGNGKQTEKVFIAKSVGDYIAKRDGSPTLYLINNAAATNLLSTPKSIPPASK